MRTANLGIVNLKVNYLFRKASGGYSIERVFQTVLEAMPDTIKTRRIEAREAGVSLFKLISNILFFHRHQADINHITGDIHYVALLLKKRKTVLTIHDLVILQKMSGIKCWIAWFLWLYLPAKRSKIITCISHKTRDEILENIKCDSDKIIVVHDPVDPAFVNISKVFCKEKPVILHFTTYENKNLHRTIPALKGISCHLRIIGKLNNRDSDLLRVNKIDYSNVYDISFQQLLDEYKKCDIVCFPSTYEGFGMPIIEAQATGRVVLSSNLQPMLEVGGDGVLYVDPYNIESISNGIKQLILDSDLREKLVAAGTENVKRFSASRIAQDYIDIYNKITKEEQR